MNTIEKIQYNNTIHNTDKFSGGFFNDNRIGHNYQLLMKNFLHKDIPKIMEIGTANGGFVKFLKDNNFKSFFIGVDIAPLDIHNHVSDFTNYNNLYDKFLIRADLTLESGRMAKVVGPGNGVIFENNQYFMPLGFIADGNLGVEYRYSKRVSAFLQINNLASQRYSRWLNYPVMPIQVMAGITARF